MAAKGQDGHRQRLREKFSSRGIEALNDDEVLELLLTLGTPRRDCKELARAMLKELGSLAGVFEASDLELQAIKGVGPSNSFALTFIHGVARRFLSQRLVGRHYLRSSREVADYLNHTMRHLQQEVFKVIFLDSSLAIIHSEILSRGTLARNTIYPREVIKAALDHNAAALVVAHNHPSGQQQPSGADKELTRILFSACALLEIQLLDHLIVGGDKRPFSFADHGLMAELAQTGP
ncbi:MAG: DNA repair protein RadC [Thermodesulfobacteriota bacterium]